MCGRYGRRGDKQKVAEAFHIKGGLQETDFDETLDAAPGSIQPVVRLGDEGNTLENMRWGFKLPDRLLFNNRSENVLTSQFFKDRFLEHRCIVPASSFFEWQDVPKGRKKPKFEITVPGNAIVGFAGLWAPWKNPKTGRWENAFSILTSDPNAKMRPFHDRQPVVLEPTEYEEWLAPSERPPVHLIRILSDERMSIRRMDALAMEHRPLPAQAGLFR